MNNVKTRKGFPTPEYQEFRRAAKWHRCTYYESAGYFEAHHSIKPGERHCVLVLMPNSETNQSGHPMRLRECLAHCSHLENEKPLAQE